MVKTIYAHSSLTTVVEPNVIEITYRAGASWQADSSTLESVSASISANNPSNANAYVYLCSQNNQGGVVGIAWLRGTCDRTGRYRSSVNEYLENDATTAIIIAHEIGHNLGMYHDFGNGGTSDTKYSASGELCTGVGGYMDYQSNPNRWSQCSVEDFTTYVNSVNPWCLDELNDVATTTTAATTTAATTTAATTTVAATTTAAVTTTDSEEETTTADDDGGDDDDGEDDDDDGDDDNGGDDDGEECEDEF